MKACSKCGVSKSLSDYYADNRTKDGKSTYCKICHELTYSTWKRANKQKVLGYNQKWYVNSGARYKRYGLSEAQYNKIYELQEGRCAICGKEETTIVRGKLRPLHIDHNHETGEFRGLLCSGCNTGIGKLRDDPELLRVAADYCASPAKPEILSIIKGDW